MSGPASRRDFLSGLVSLPLMGGVVTLIESASTVAQPASDEMIREYMNWLPFERFRTAAELGLDDRYGNCRMHGVGYRWHRDWSLTGHAPGAYPADRAALVLATVGCDWWEGRR